MSLPALRAVRHRFPKAHITVHAVPWVADVYARESFADRILPLHARRGPRDWTGKWHAVKQLHHGEFDAALLLPNSFEAAALVWAARIPVRAGYSRDGRGMLLTDAIPRPAGDAIPRHEVFYYLELLRRLGWIHELPAKAEVALENRESLAAAGRARLDSLGLPGAPMGICPGAAFGTAKRWLPERFAETGLRLYRQAGLTPVVFGTPQERDVCADVAARMTAAGVTTRNLAGETTLRDFIEMAAACRLFLTNDSGSMHLAAAAGTPTVAVFGATDFTTTGPASPSARVVYRKVDCSPCQLRVCPIDHRCMRAVDVETVAETALNLLK
jgi:heptosyltransferase-2